MVSNPISKLLRKFLDASQNLNIQSVDYNYKGYIQQLTFRAIEKQPYPDNFFLNNTMSDFSNFYHQTFNLKPIYHSEFLNI